MLSRQVAKLMDAIDAANEVMVALRSPRLLSGTPTSCARCTTTSWKGYPRDEQHMPRVDGSF